MRRCARRIEPSPAVTCTHFGLRVTRGRRPSAFRSSEVAFAPQPTCRITRVDGWSGGCPRWESRLVSVALMAQCGSDVVRETAKPEAAARVRGSGQDSLLLPRKETRDRWSAEGDRQAVCVCV